MHAHPVSFSVVRPQQFDRIHVVVRLALLLALALTGLPQGGWFIMLVLLLPAFAAVQSSKKGGRAYLHEDGPRVMTLLHWVLAASAYLGLLTDLLPDGSYRENVDFAVAAEGDPTPASALWRLLMSLPALLVMTLLGVFSAVVWMVAMVMVAVTGNYPAVMFQFQCDVVRYLARTLAYHASLVETYAALTHGAAASHGDLAHPHVT